MGSALKFNQTDVARQTGELARLKVVRGPDYGTLFVLTGARATIGRGEENDIVISDLKASRRHAEFAWSVGSGWSVADIGSSNGIGYRGQELRRVKLAPLDSFSLGETVFEFVSAEGEGRALGAASPHRQSLVEGDPAFERQRQRVRALGRSGPEPRSIPAASGASTGKLVVPLLLAVGAVFYFGGESPRPKGPARSASAKSTDAGREPASPLLLPPMPGEVEGETSRAAEMFFREGFREYRERNYLRAKSNFENVLQVSSGHALARLYLDNSVKAIQDEIATHLEQGKRGVAAGKLKAARGHFEAVLRLLSRDTSNPRYTEAKEALERLEHASKGGSG